MSKKSGVDYLEPTASDAPEYLTDSGAQASQEVTSLESYLATKRAKYETAVINGRLFHFQSGSPKAKDALLAKHSKDDGMGNVTVEQTMWRTDAIALTWVTGPGGARVLDSAEKAHRFHAEADADEELEMYKVAARMLGLKEKDEKEAAEKNSGRGGGISGSVTSPSDTFTLYPEKSLLS